MSVRETIIEVVNKLFIYTDMQNWKGLQEEVFREHVHLDMSSMGGDASNMTAREICEMWEEGFKDLDAVNHLAGNYLVNLVSENEAHVFAYATATHYKESAKNGKTREFVGTYDLKLKKVGQAWKIDFFKYNLKYMDGNAALD
jgi:hypothetical protein